MRTSQESAAEFLRLRDHRNGKSRLPKLDTVCLREVILGHITEHPISARDLYNAVANDYGNVHVRRFWRALRWALDLQKIERASKPHSAGEYIRRRAA